VTFVTIESSQQNPEQDAGTRGYLAVPGSPGPWPGVVLIPEVYGLEDNMIKHADRLASAGYLTLAVDLTGGQRGLRCVAAAMMALRRGHGPQFAAIESARLWLLGRADCTGRIGAIGFCVGGGFALLTASTGFDVMADNYGNLPADPDAALDGACPIVANYGKRDRTLRGAAAKLDAALTRLGVEHDVREFENAGHAFLNEHDAGPRAMLPLLRVMGVGPVPQAAPEAWARIEDYFARYLR
jgi:carboxymethylenebutenolidase